jgi:hypothetical protein
VIAAPGGGHLCVCTFDDCLLLACVVTAACAQASVEHLLTPTEGGLEQLPVHGLQPSSESGMNMNGREQLGVDSM